MTTGLEINSLSEPGASASASFLDVLWELGRRAREAGSDRELGFLLVNDSHDLVRYRQAALWLADGGVHTLSGVVQIEANAPYVQWLSSVCRHLASQQSQITEVGGTGVPGVIARPVTSADLPDELAADWASWWPEHALWLGRDGQGACILVRDEPWADAELQLLVEWSKVWWHAFDARRQPRLRSWLGWRPSGKRAWWKRPGWLLTLVVLAALCCPVRLTVLAPGELVPAHPVVIRAPLDGVIDVFHVQPNQTVKKDQPLFGFDEALIQSRLQVAQQALATLRTDYRQTSQMALSDVKAKAQLASMMGKADEKRAEVDFLSGQLQRARVLAPQAGVVLMDDPAEWIGRPVSVGERIMRLAVLDDTEVEIWLPLADAIELAPGAPVSLYLNASPMAPITARLRYLAHDAVQRPDGHYAYRARATLDQKTAHRVGLKGTGKLEGDWVPLGYWMMRRPLATARAYLGL
jgi:hypothetical protein